VVGAGGLLGGAVCRAAAARDHHVSVARVCWTDPATAKADLRRAVNQLFDRVGRTGGTWHLAWCAGAGVTGTSPEVLDAEVDSLRVTLAATAVRLDSGPDLARRGSVFVASSVGGIHGGGAEPPFTEHHPPSPTSPYGRAKLAGEQVAAGFAATSGVPTVIGRITNLYGPGQNLAKPQGLISHLCRAHLTRNSLSVYVPLDTIRDYLYVDDCADMVCDALAGAADIVEPATPMVKILAAHQGVTVGTLLGEFRRVFKRSPLVVLGSSDSARFQSPDLRVRSVVWPELDHRPLTSLPSGLAATAEDLFRTVKGAG
jgi:UDP-glucose 4-epimerase